MGQSPHVFSLRNVSPQVDRDGGSRLSVDASTFPILRGLSLYRAVLKPLGLREPHWHPNANELTYCLRGEALEPISKSSEEDHEAGELYKAEEVLSVVLPADEDATLPLYPGEEPLDEPSPRVTA